MIDPTRACAGHGLRFRAPASFVALLLAAAALVAMLPSEARAKPYNFPAEECAIDVPDTGWIVLNSQISLPTGAAAKSLLLVTGDSVTIMLLSAQDESFADLSDDEALTGLVTGMAGHGAVVTSRKTTTFKGHPAYAITAMMPADHSTFWCLVVPNGTRLYMVMVIGNEEGVDAEHHKPAQDVIQTFRITAPIVPKGNLPSFETVADVARWIIPAGIIVSGLITWVSVTTKRRRQREQQERDALR